MYEIEDNFVENFISGLTCEAFKVYCKQAGALLNYDNLEPGTTRMLYGIRFYSEKMVKKYGNSYLQKFDNYLCSEKRYERVRKLLNTIVSRYTSDIEGKVKGSNM